MRTRIRCRQVVIGGLAAFLIVPLIWSAIVVAQAALSFAARDGPIGLPGCDPIGDPDCSDGPFDVVTGDFDGDDILDVATANNATDDVTILLGDGDGNLTVFDRFPADVAPAAIAAGDIDGDLVLDLAVTNEFGDTVTILLGNGDGSFDPAGNLEVGQSPGGGSCLPISTMTKVWMWRRPISSTTRSVCSSVTGTERSKIRLRSRWKEVRSIWRRGM